MDGRQELKVSSSNLDRFDTFKLPNLPTEAHIVPPAFTDTLLHAAGFMANLSVESEEICICSHVDQVEVFFEALDFDKTFAIYCNIFDDVRGSIPADVFVRD